MVWKVSEARRKLKLRAIAYKGGKCEECGYGECPAALTFHHKDPSKKDFGLGSCIRSWDSVQKEIEKCRLLCANCHAEVHYEETEAQRKTLEQEVRKLVPVRTL